MNNEIGIRFSEAESAIRQIQNANNGLSQAANNVVRAAGNGSGWEGIEHDTFVNKLNGLMNGVQQQIEQLWDLVRILEMKVQQDLEEEQRTINEVNNLY